MILKMDIHVCNAYRQLTIVPLLSNHAHACYYERKFVSMSTLCL